MPIASRSSDAIRLLTRHADAIRRSAVQTSGPDSVFLDIAAQQEAGTVAFATVLGEHLAALETFLAAKRANLERLERERGSQGMSPLAEGEYLRAVRDVEEVVALRAEFERYTRRQERQARRLLREVTPTQLRTGVASMLHRSLRDLRLKFERQPFARAPQVSPRVRMALGGGLFAFVVLWSLQGRPADTVAAATPSAPAPVPVVVTPAPEIVQQPPWVPTSVLGPRRMVALYGHPGQETMGILGTLSPEDAAQEAIRRARAETRPDEPPAVGALELIVAVAQAKPTDDGTYLLRMSDSEVERYVEVARAHHIELILDIQVGWSDALTEVRHYADFLTNPFVHVALDPEFATRSLGVAPGAAIGRLDARSVNAVEAYLGDVVREHRLPKKLLILHQFRADMLPDTASYRGDPAVERIIDADGFGPPGSKLEAYTEFATVDHAHYPAIKLFLHWDEPLLTPEQLNALPEPPTLVIYQ